MTKQTRRRFSLEYKEQSVARLSEPGATHSSVASELGVTPTQLKTLRPRSSRFSLTMPQPVTKEIAEAIKVTIVSMMGK